MWSNWYAKACLMVGTLPRSWIKSITGIKWSRSQVTGVEFLSYLGLSARAPVKWAWCAAYFRRIEMACCNWHSATRFSTKRPKRKKKSCSVESEWTWTERTLSKGQHSDITAKTQWLPTFACEQVVYSAYQRQGTSNARCFFISKSNHGISCPGFLREVLLRE